MNYYCFVAFFQVSSFGRYFIHFLFVILSLGGVVFGAGNFESRMENIDLKNPEQVLEVVGKVWASGDFSALSVFQGMLFSREQSFTVEKESSVTLDFGGFTVARLRESTKATIKEGEIPIVDLQEGEIWLSTKSNAIIRLPNMEVFVSAGTANISYQNGKATMKAIQKALVIRFIESDQKDSSFLLPDHHQVVLVPNALLSSTDQEKLRFSKLKKEFHLSLFADSEMILSEKKKDEVFFQSMKRKIITFTFSSAEKDLLEQENTLSEKIAFFQKKQEENMRYRKMLQKKEIWDIVQKGKSSILTSKIQNVSISSAQESQYWNALSLFAENSSVSEQQAIFTVLKKKSTERNIPSAFFDFLLLEHLMSTPGELDTKNFPKTFALISDKILLYLTTHPQDLDKYYLLVSSLLKNYPQKMTNETVSLLQGIGDSLIAKETDPYFKTTQKIELTNETFNLVSDLLKNKSYPLAKLLIESSMDRINPDETPELASVYQKLLEQKTEVEHRILFYQVVGGGTEEEFQAFSKGLIPEDPSISFGAEELALREKFKSYAEQRFNDAHIHIETIEQEPDAPHLFSISMAVNEQNIPFSALYNADSNTFTGVIFLLKDQSVVAYNAYKPEEISKLTNEDVLIFSSSLHSSGETGDPNASVSPEENTYTLSPDVIELAIAIAQKDFQDIISVKAIDIEVQSSEFVVVKSAKVIFYDQEVVKFGEKPLHEDFTFSFTYSLKDHMVTEAHILKSAISLQEKISLKDLVVRLDTLSKENRATEELLNATQSKFASAGFSAQITDFEVLNATSLKFSNIAFNKTLFFSGVYNAEKEVFTTISEKINTVASQQEIPFLDFVDQTRTYMFEIEKQKKLTETPKV